MCCARNGLICERQLRDVDGLVGVGEGGNMGLYQMELVRRRRRRLDRETESKRAHLVYCKLGWT